MQKLLLQTLGLTIQLTLLPQSCFIFITQTKSLQINTWRVGIQTPYQTLPTVVNLDEGITSNQLIDNMVRSMTKKLGMPVVASVNVGEEYLDVGRLGEIGKAVVEAVMAKRKEGEEGKSGDKGKEIEEKQQELVKEKDIQG